MCSAGAAGAASRALARAVRALPGPGAGAGDVVHVALSGGVDSSVAALVLRERGWAVRPVVLRCWDARLDDGDDGAGAGCFAGDARAAQSAAAALRLPLPLATFDLVADYWNAVFAPALAGFARGDTPNPDVACNAAVKFGAFPARLRAEAAAGDGGGGGPARTPPFATGHYARLARPAAGAGGGAPPALARAADVRKDQTYFLAGVAGADLAGALFPLGGLAKAETRAIARWAGLPAAGARSSRGICFVGKRPLAPFLARYLPPARAAAEGGGGTFVDARSGEQVAPLPAPAHAFTVGQRARIAGRANALFVCGKTPAGDVLVADAGDAALLDAKEFPCRDPHWIAGAPPPALREGPLRLTCKTNSTAPWRPCEVMLQGDRLTVVLDEPVRRMGPGQMIVLYDGEVCLGGGYVAQ